MLEKFFTIVFPSSESSFIYYILPSISSVVLIALIWLIFGGIERFIKINIRKWEKPNYEKNKLQNFIINFSSLFQKTLNAFRWILLLYIVLNLISHILETFSSQIKDALAHLAFESSRTWSMLSTYSEKMGVLFDKTADLIMKVSLTILVAVWGMRLLQKGLEIIMDKSENNKLGLSNGRSIAKKKTLNVVASHSLKVIVIAITVFSILQTLGINIAALLATAGLATVAIGLGAQTLVKDFIAGFFILLEDQFAVGDAVDINNFSGSVEKMTLRIIRLRSNEGSLITIPNGDIRSVRNYTTDWSRIDFKYSLEIKSNLEKAAQVFREEVEKLCRDYSEEVLGTPDIKPFEKIMDSPENKTVSTTFRAYIKTISTSAKGKIEMELNKRLITRFKNEEVLFNK